MYLFIISISILLFTLIKKKEYALAIETSAGTNNVFTSNKEKFIDKLIDTISQVMEKPNESTNIIVDGRQIINNTKNVQGDNVSGDKYGNIGDNNIMANRSKGTNISNNFTENSYISKELDNIEKHIHKYKDTGSIILLEKLREEINVTNPDKSKITAIWNSLVKILPDASKVATSVATIADKII